MEDVTAIIPSEQPQTLQNQDLSIPGYSFGTQYLDSITGGSITVREHLFNEMTRQKTQEELQNIRNFLDASLKAEEAEKLNRFQNLALGWERMGVQNDIAEDAEKLREMYATGTYALDDLEALEDRIARNRWKLSKMLVPEDSGAWSAYNVGAGLRSMTPGLLAEMGFMAGEGVLGLGIGAVTGPVGAGAALTAATIAAGRRAVKARNLAKRGFQIAKGLYMWDLFSRRESGGMYSEIMDRTDLTEEQKQAMAVTYGRLSGAVELLGWNLGAGGLAAKGIKAISKKLPSSVEKWTADAALKEALKAQVKEAAEKTWTTRAINIAKGVARVGVGALSESAEEGSQRAMEAATIRQGTSGETPTYTSVLGEGFKLMAGVPAELVQGKLSEDSIAILEAMGSALLPSLIVGGAGYTLSSAASYASEITPADTGRTSNFVIKNNSLKSAFLSAEKNLAKLTAVSEFMGDQSRNTEYKLQVIDGLINEAKLEGAVHFTPEDTELLLALGESNPTLQNTMTRLGITDAIREGRKTGTVSMSMRAFAELASQEDIRKGEVGKKLNMSGTVALSDSSYSRIERNVIAGQKKGKELVAKPTPKLERKLTGLRRRFKTAGYADEEIEANIAVFASALATVAEASNGAVTIDELIDDFKFDIEKRDFTITSSDVQSVVSKVLADKRNLLGSFTRYVEKGRKRLSSKENSYTSGRMPGLKPVRPDSDVFIAEKFGNLVTFLRNMPEGFQARIMFDKSKNIWLVSDAYTKTHEEMLIEAWAGGLYENFKSEGEVSSYFNEDTYAEQFSENGHNLYRFSVAHYSEENTVEDIVKEFEDAYQLFYNVPYNEQEGILLFTTSREAVSETELKSVVAGAGLYTRKNGFVEEVEAPGDQSVIDGKLSSKFELFDETGGMRGPKRIYVAKHADVTTFAHEIMHFVTRSLIEMYNDGSISEMWRREVEKLYDHFSEMGSMRKDRFGKIEMKKDASETLSSGFQRYMEEGVADNSALRKLFAFIKDLAADIWSVLNRGYYKDRELSGAQIKFYDKVMRAQVDIKNTEYKYGYAPLEKMSGVSDEEYEEYTIERKVARSKSSNNMFKAQRQMVKNRKRAEWIKFYDEEFVKAIAELRNEPEYRVMQFILDNGGLNKVSMKNGTRLAGAIPPKYFSKASADGVTVEQLDAKFGPEISIADIAKILAETPSLDVAARRRARTEADRRFLEEFDPAADLTPANAMRTILFIRSLVKESLMIKGEPLSSFPAHYAAWIKEAEDYFMGLTVKNAKDLEKWADMESRVTDDFMAAFTDGNTDLAALKADQRAMVNYVLVRSKQLRKLEAKFKRRFKKFYSAPQGKDIQVMDGVTWNLIHTILQEYGFTRKSGRLSATAKEQFTAWVETRKGKQYFPYETLVNEIGLLSDIPKNTSLSVERFNRMVALVETIRSIGEAEKKVFDGQKRAQLDVVAGEIIDNVMKIRATQGDKAFTAYGKGSWSRLTVPQMGMLEPLFGMLGMRKLYVALRNALVARDDLADNTRTFIADSFERNKIGDLLADKTEFLVGERTVTNNILLFALQHSGNNHNRDNAIVTLQQYYKDPSFSEAEYEEFLNAAPMAMRNYVNDLWAMFKNMKSLIDEQARVATGELIATVEARPYTLRDGTQMTGGYFPAKKVNKVGVTDPLDTYYDNNFLYPRAGLLKDRLKNATGNLDLSQDALSRWIFQAVNLATTQVAFNDIATIFKDENVIAAFGPNAGLITQYVNDWLQAAVLPVAPQPKTLRAISRGPTVVFLGFKAVSGLVQLLGTLVGLNEVSVPSLLSSSGKLLNVGKYFKIGEEMSKRSAFMADRARKFDSRFFGLMKDENMLQKATRKYGDGIVAASMSFVRTFQCMADLVVWDGAFADGKKSGMSDKDASDHADYIVMKTQGDRVQMNTPEGFQGALRFFQPFMTYVLTLNQMGSAAVRSRNFKKLGALVALIVLSNALEAYFKENDKEWRRKLLGKKTKGTSRDFWKRYRNRFLVQTVSTLGDVAIPFAGIGGTLSLTLTEDMLKSVSPGYRAYTAGATPAVEVLVNATKAIRLDKETWKSIYDWDMSLGANLVDFVL